MFICKVCHDTGCILCGQEDLASRTKINSSMPADAKIYPEVRKVTLSEKQARELYFVLQEQLNNI